MIGRHILWLLIPLMFASCRLEKEKSIAGRMKIVCTTGILADGVRAIVGDHADVVTLMGPGVDPHMFKPTPKDMEVLEKANVIIHNGLHLEGKLGEVFQELAREKYILAFSDGISDDHFILIDEQAKVYDPHIWFDVPMWSQGMRKLADRLGSIDTINALSFVKNYADYAEELDHTDSLIKVYIDSIPIPKRMMITSHDAFNYLGRAYDIQVHGIQGTSTSTEYGLKDVAHIVDMITENNIPTVFIESSVNEKSISSVIEGCSNEGHQVGLGGTLYSDALGDAGTPQGTYTGMLLHNAKTISNGLAR